MIISAQQCTKPNHNIKNPLMPKYPYDVENLMYRAISALTWMLIYGFSINSYWLNTVNEYIRILYSMKNLDKDQV